METSVPETTEPDATWTVTALAALAHEHRLAAYRLLVEAGPAGVAAGEIAEKLGLVSSSLTFHIQALLRAGLISQRRASRHLIYAADFAAMDGLILFLVSNCCDQESEVYPPLCNPILGGRSQAAQKRKRRSV